MDQVGESSGGCNPWPILEEDKTETDSEVLIHLYEDCKTEMVKKLRGMFAFVIWDKNEKTLFAARDHFAKQNSCD